MGWSPVRCFWSTPWCRPAASCGRSSRAGPLLPPSRAGEDRSFPGSPGLSRDEPGGIREPVSGASRGAEPDLARPGLGQSRRRKRAAAPAAGGGARRRARPPPFRRSASPRSRPELEVSGCHPAAVGARGGSVHPRRPPSSRSAIGRRIAPPPPSGRRSSEDPVYTSGRSTHVARGNAEERINTGEEPRGATARRRHPRAGVGTSRRRSLILPRLAATAREAEAIRKWRAAGKVKLGSRSGGHPRRRSSPGNLRVLPRPPLRNPRRG